MAAPIYIRAATLKMMVTLLSVINKMVGVYEDGEKGREKEDWGG